MKNTGSTVKEKVNLTKALKDHFGFSKFKGNQEKIIQSLLDGRDTFVIMPTGGGKSLCYQLPALMSEGTAIIISPLIALMKNQVDQIRSYSDKDHVAHFLNSSLSKTQAAQVKKDITDGKTKMLYVAPETLGKDVNIKFFSEINISFIAVDEAHCISEWGHDFRPDYRRIKAVVEAIDHRIPIIALTATATPKVQLDIVKTMGMEDPNIFISSFNRPNLYYEVRPKGPKDALMKNIIKFIKQNEGKSGIIYTLSRKSTEEIAETLQVNGILAVAYHAGLEAHLRAERQDQFINEDIHVIVATIAFGMGIDKPDVRFVIHYNIPKSIENYYQETGRAGRDGLEGNCIAYYNYTDIQKLEKFMRDKGSSEREFGGHLLVETMAYAETSVCRRKFILHYFGEELEQKNCSNCDNCLHPKEQIDGSQYIKAVLEAVAGIKESFTIPYIVNILIGAKNQEVANYRHDKLKVFGIGKEKDDHFWNSIVRQALINNFIIKDIENYGVIALSEKGKKFLKKPTKIMVSLNHDFEGLGATNDDEGGGGATSLDPVLFKMLKDLTKEVGKANNLPHFVIFQEPSLIDMSTQYPTTMEELANISGVSKGKAERYGEQFVEMIAQYVEDNDIDKPTDVVVKSVVNKSAMKIYIIQNIDKKIPLEQIARGKGLKLDDVLQEMETIILSGTKLNLNYYINDMMEEERQEEVIEYFRTAESDSFDDAMTELGEENYTNEELKLMRLKFLSDMGN